MIPPQIHSVPALLLFPAKNIIYGKQVFDHLLLPGKGILTTGITKDTAQSQGGSPHKEPSDPQAFSLLISNATGDNFSFIEDSNSFADTNRNYVWTSINDDDIVAKNSYDTNAHTTQESTRVKKETLDLDEYKARRADDMNIVLNTNIPLTPAVTY